jgi:hypothetical protein
VETQPITAPKEWDVLFSHEKNWRIGAYRPRHRAAAEITELEQHTCPESFVLLEGEVVMIYREATGEIREKKLLPLELTTFTEPHAGYSPQGNGLALVVENAVFETTYTGKTSGAFMRRVSVAPAT